MSNLRKTTTNTVDFRRYADRVHSYFTILKWIEYSILVEEGYCELPATEVDVITPCGVYKGVEYPKNICAVSIMRSGSSLLLIFIIGDSLLQAFMDAFPEAPIGKVLIQRDENSEDKKPIVWIDCIYDW